VSSPRRVLYACLSLAASWSIGAPAAHADDGRGVLGAAGARLSVARASYAGQFIDESVADRNPFHGFAPGVFARLELARPGGVGIGLQTELGYGPRGTDVELDGVFQGRSRASYLELPILARIDTAAMGPVTFQVTAGPTLSFLLAARSEPAGGDGTDVTDGTRKLDVALTAGLGASIAVTSRVALSLETRYVHGFLTTADSGDIELLNRALMFSLGVEARFGVDQRRSLQE
jgi:opacity protein-like surface antigen